MRPELLRALPSRAAGRRAPRAVAVLVAAVAALSACGGGVAGSVADSSTPAASSAPADPGSAGGSGGESSASGAVIGDGTVSFPADRGVPDLELPDGATAYDTTFNASIGISVTDVVAADLVESLSGQLSEAGFTVEQLSDDLAQATKEGASQVTLAGLGADSVDISVSPAP